MGYWGSKTTASPTLYAHRHIHISARINQKIWIHQNLLGHGCSNSAQTVCLCSSSSDPGIVLWFLHGCQITLPPLQSSILCLCLCVCDLTVENRGMKDSSYTSTGPSKIVQIVRLVKSRTVFQTQHLVL